MPNWLVAYRLGAYARAHEKWQPLLVLCAACVVAWQVPGGLYAIQYPLKPNTYEYVSYTFWQHGDKIRDELMRKFPGMKLIDMSDGMFAYMLDMPAECTNGLPSSPADLQRRKEMGVWKSALSRGFNVVPQVPYLKARPLPDTIIITKTVHPVDSPLSFYQLGLREH